MNSQNIAILIFLAAYLLFIIFPSRRTYVAIGGSIMLILTGTLTLSDSFSAINWNVMGIFVGTLFIADVFMESRVPAYLAEVIVDKIKSTRFSILAICIMTSFISAFVENVATVLIVAPIAIALAKKLKINPTNIMIAIAISSNLQGTATLIGDPPSMLLGGFAKMNFFDFFFYKGLPGIFFAVQIGAIASFVVLWFIFRKHKEKDQPIRVESVRSWVPTNMLVGLIITLALSSFFDSGFSYLAGIICMVFGIASIIWDKFSNKRSMLNGLKKLDWDTAIFLIGVFVLVGSITHTGWIDVISSSLVKISGADVFWGYTLLVVVAVIVSAFVDNVPFLVAMLPVAMSMSDKLSIDPSLFLFGLLIGASLGGNITPIGASANIVACGILKKEGYKVTFGQFTKIGLPFTLAAIITAYVFLWLIWGPK